MAAVCDGAGGIDEGQQFSFCRADFALYPQADARALVVAGIFGTVIVGKILVLVRVVIQLVDTVPVPVIGVLLLPGSLPVTEDYL